MDMQEEELSRLFDKWTKILRIANNWYSKLELNALKRN